MKTQNRFSQSASALMALSALLILPPSASAIVFTYEDTTSGHAIGEVFTGGGFRINLQNFDMGTTYPALNPVGTSAGFGEGAPAANVNAGITALNGIQLAGPTGGVGPEDTGGIARIVTITDLAGAVIWSETGKNAQITSMFYGERDFYVQQLANGFQNIDGIGLVADLYYQSKTVPLYTPYNPLPGSAGRIDGDSYTTVTDGEMFLKTTSVANFIHGPNVLGGLATEFNTTFNITSGGQGQAYLSVIGGTDMAQFNTNGFTSPFVPGTTADLFAQFTTIAPSGVSDWLVASNDPIRGNMVSVPDGGSTLLMLGAGLACLGLGYRRKA